ncbi:CPM [Cordylochernes scorpioides]|uniref:CPM n=1 Tax=Cordylochernes scorpioides TaxID=51811 RepID=A0ABY6KTB1_9ARAC|nr:CPM [Cordylochernes scorpioides]
MCRCTGGMQDFGYVWGGQMSLSLELSCCKFPVEAELPNFWEENRVALVRFAFEAHRGVKGIVKDTEERPLNKASLVIMGRNINFSTTRRGEFWRILLPGTYTLQVNVPLDIY